jgi:hypothetical protein
MGGTGMDDGVGRVGDILKDGGKKLSLKQGDEDKK